ncbi:SsrA-binding protein [Candidatus Pantoea edessiphila]|uniref:SsrA-binding protein n=2 Tax=Candidatus Pantoea edessiphila TaxID=2044610 RepID=A0A2P5SWH4_9GAMM|nr:SsrA-binding protein SmpB [Candidatus Pantoea edessiphila]PPI86661.1 SsrA-binding protein [Candidatus Pantoea edessiphila]
MTKISKKPNFNIITKNKHAYHEYFIEKEFEAGLVLQGWEVKSLRAGKVNISESYILLYEKEAYLLGSTLQPLIYVSNSCSPDPKRRRKLLLTKPEINYLYYNNKQKGYTIIALSMYWKNALCKLKIGISHGKKKHDKRNEIKNREWKINKSRILKNTKITKD